MSEKDQTKRPETKEAQAEKTPEGAYKAEAEKAKQKAVTTGALSSLRHEIGASSNEISFSDNEKQQAKQALGFEISKMDKKTLAYRIKMLDMDTIEKAENVAAGIGAKLFAIMNEKSVPIGYKFAKDDKLTVHFRDNEVAESGYGMRHLFKNQPEVRAVYISHSSQRGKGKEGLATRRSLDGNFHFADGSYAPIFTGTKIEIKEVFTTEQLEEYKKSSNEYTVDGGTKRYIPKAEEEKYEKEYAITPPTTKTDSKKAEEYWQRIDATDYSQSDPDTQAKRSTVNEQEYIPANEREGAFISKWREIMSINDKQRLIDMKDEIRILSDDPIVNIPGEIRGTRLRSGAALRYALFKRHAQLNGHEVEITSSYRSTREQQVLWNRGLVRRMREFRQKYPSKSAREIERLAINENAQFVAPPGRSHHNTGGAADIRISGMEMSKYKGSKDQYERARQTGNFAGMSRADKVAVETRIYMDKVLLASHFMGTNYFRETWHWNIDNQNGKDVYGNV